MKKGEPFFLSDPSCDFVSSSDQEWLKATMAKQGKGLTSYDFLCIFQTYLPAGTYEECLYYLPLAFDFMLKEKLESSLLENVLFYVNSNVDKLKETELWNTLIAFLKKTISRALDLDLKDKNFFSYLFEAQNVLSTIFSFKVGTDNIWSFFIECIKQNTGAWEYVVLATTMNEWDGGAFSWSETNPRMLGIWNDFFGPNKLMSICEKMLANCDLFSNDISDDNWAKKYYIDQIEKYFFSNKLLKKC